MEDKQRLETSMQQALQLIEDYHAIRLGKVPDAYSLIHACWVRASLVKHHEFLGLLPREVTQRPDYCLALSFFAEQPPLLGSA